MLPPNCVNVFPSPLSLTPVAGLDLTEMTRVAERTITDDLEYLISQAVDPSKADYAGGWLFFVLKNKISGAWGSPGGQAGRQGWGLPGRCCASAPRMRQHLIIPTSHLLHFHTAPPPPAPIPQVQWWRAFRCIIGAAASTTPPPTSSTWRPPGARGWKGLELSMFLCVCSCNCMCVCVQVAPASSEGKPAACLGGCLPAPSACFRCRPCRPVTCPSSPGAACTWWSTGSAHTWTSTPCRCVS